MTDYIELKRLARAANPGPWSSEGDNLYWHVDGYTKHLMEAFDGNDLCHDEDHPANLKFIAAANPAAILALIAENERLAEDHDKAWRHGLNDRNNVQALAGELAGAQAMLETAYSERDQLKAENERLQASLQGYQMGAKAEAEEADRLRGEVKEMRESAGLSALLPQLDEALEDLELHGRHADQGYRKLKDWYRKVKLACAAIDAAMAKEARP